MLAKVLERPTMDDNVPDLFAGLISEEAMCAQRRITVRQSQRERRMGMAPPWVKIGRDVYFDVEGFRQYVREKMVTPSRGPYVTSA